jgi:pyruvate dehydrogenase E2 component (dihydrolipoamide acetyltransferase)
VGGRNTAGDLEIAPAAAATGAGGFEQDYEIVNLSYTRKIIAKNMYTSLSSTAQLTLHVSFDASDILAFRERIKENGDKLGLEDITLNDIILYAVSRTLVNHKELNAHLVEDRMLVFKNVHLGVAVDTERGLMVPTVFNANLKSLNEISREVKELVEQCRRGTINPDKLKGGTFTVTNLGGLGVESFTPILNPPQTGILGVCSVVYRIKKVGGEDKCYPAMGLSLTFDHRALDGAPAARFLKELRDNLENFSLLLAR